MKILSKTSILIFALIVGLSTSAEAQPRDIHIKPLGTKISAIVLPNAKEAIRVLLANGDIQMSAVKSCRSMKTAEDDRTIFDYLSGILAFQAEPKSKTSIGYDVKLIKGKNGVHFWEVNLVFKGLDEESGDPWNNGFRFLMRTRDKRMVRSSFQCTG